jgi:hypothetical protein
MFKLEEAIKGCDSRRRRKFVRLRQKLEQRRAGAGAMEPRSQMYKWPSRAKDHTLVGTASEL